MKKIICIGECALDIIFRGETPVGAMPGGRIVNAAACMASRGLPVKLVSELAVGSVGDIIYDYLTNASVDCTSLDRFTEGLSPVIIYNESDSSAGVTRYEQYPDECFDVVWPRIDEGDIILFGGFYAIDGRMRHRMLQLLQHAAERKAALVYLPGYMPQQQPRITRVMPAILENMELASLVITRSKDLEIIFGNSDTSRCYHNHIDFYCHSLINVDANSRKIEYLSGSQQVTAEIGSDCSSSLLWNACAVAAIVEKLFATSDVLNVLDAPSDDFCHSLVQHALTEADHCLDAVTDVWKKKH